MSTLPGAAAVTDMAELVPEPFLLYRQVDHTGVSGTGVVATGCRFSDGTVVVRWRGDHASTVVWDHRESSLDHALAVHSHGGATRVLWPHDVLTDIHRAQEGHR